ncbi:MAG: M24 family metallopeptidase [Chitinophagaceae bacterium]|nr:M24 family metallopeptidase [Chitinophagaceae bacterium]
MRKLLAGGLLTLLSVISYSQALPLREQARIINTLLAERLNTLLPVLMERSNIDCWVIISREYNEDPVLRTMLPAEWLNARRRTIFVFYRDSVTKSLEKLAITRYNAGNEIKAVWDMQRFPDQWDALVNLLISRGPRRIAVDISTDFGHADGMDHTDYQELLRRLPEELRTRVISAQPLAVGWLETRTPQEMEFYPRLVQYTHAIIAEAFSSRAIRIGVTSTGDLEWWLRQRIRDSGFDTWFHPTVDIQREEGRSKDDIIRSGDLLHVDFGITYLRLNTDVQEHAYVLKPGETAVPAGLKAAFDRAGRLQDILTAAFSEGRTGNQILAAALARASLEGIQGAIYTHPIGYHGHGAGPAIGLWDRQGGVSGSGDFPMHNRTAYSVELNAVSEVPEWKKAVKIMLEEDGYFDEKGFRYINGRQREMFLIRGD